MKFKNIGHSPDPVSATFPKYFRTASYFALLVGLGLLGNYFKYPLFLGIDFLFGNIFALVALQVLGWGRGVLAAAIIASYTILLWNHPYYVVILTAEVAVVGFLTARYKVGLVLADALYWVTIGMALSYVLYRGVLDVPSGNAFLIICKSAINGIASALVARLLVVGFSVGLRGKRVALRDMTYNLLASEPALPWDKTQFYWGDERHVPPDHPDSNFGMANAALLSRITPGHVFRMKGELPDTREAARLYADHLPRFDLVLLGMGPFRRWASLAALESIAGN